MKTGNKYNTTTLLIVAIILVISFLIKLASYYPLWIEEYYSQGIYLHISRFFRALFGWIPFSFGDIFYAGAGFYLLLTFIKFVKILTRKEFGRYNYGKTVLKIFLILTGIYIYFNLSWGLNYNRPGISYQLGLNPETHNEADLKLITEILLNKVNEKRVSLQPANTSGKPFRQIFADAELAFQSASSTFPFLQYKTGSIKRSMYGKMGNFLGFLGYYNPFSGEAQVNLTQPKFLIPYVSCHEMAHQLGYASESEASFVGYLAATHSSDTFFHYSAYFDLFNYANRELSYRDSVAARNNYRKLDTLVKKDMKELYEYWRKSDNIFEPIIKFFYDRYLKANQQVKGIKSYNEVIGWLIAYYKKYGKI